MFVHTFGPIAIQIAFAIGFTIVILILIHSLGPKKYNPIKYDTYECGVEYFNDARGIFHVKFSYFPIFVYIYMYNVYFTIVPKENVEIELMDYLSTIDYKGNILPRLNTDHPIVVHIRPSLNQVVNIVC